MRTILKILKIDKRGKNRGFVVASCDSTPLSHVTLRRCPTWLYVSACLEAPLRHLFFSLRSKGVRNKTTPSLALKSTLLSHAHTHSLANRKAPLPGSPERQKAKLATKVLPLRHRVKALRHVKTSYLCHQKCIETWKRHWLWAYYQT